jgi:hypothetical protein
MPVISPLSPRVDGDLPGSVSLKMPVKLVEPAMKGSR